MTGLEYGVGSFSELDLAVIPAKTSRQDGSTKQHYLTYHSAVSTMVLMVVGLLLQHFQPGRMGGIIALVSRALEEA